MQQKFSIMPLTTVNRCWWPSRFTVVASYIRYIALHYCMFILSNKTKFDELIEIANLAGACRYFLMCHGTLVFSFVFTVWCYTNTVYITSGQTMAHEVFYVVCKCFRAAPVPPSIWTIPGICRLITHVFTYVEVTFMERHNVKFTFLCYFLCVANNNFVWI